MSAEEAAPQPEPQAEPQAAGDDDPAPEEEVTAQWESKYKDLKEVKVESGEEEDDILFKMRCKIFHFQQAEEKYGGQKEWKEKGVGEPSSLSLSLSLAGSSLCRVCVRACVRACVRVPRHLRLHFRAQLLAFEMD